jgi:hypothetical protein
MNKRGGLTTSAIILAIVFIIGFVAGFKFDFGKENSALKEENAQLLMQVEDLQAQVFNLQNINITDVLSCQTDSDCIVQQVPYCCGEDIGGTYRACRNSDYKPPETLDCVGNDACPGDVLPFETCECRENLCRPV